MLAELLGRGAPVRFGPFHGVVLDKAVTLDFMRTDGDIDTRHYAFLVTEPEFDEIFGRIRARGLAYFADPGHRRASEINRNDGGRGVYPSFRGAVRSGQARHDITRCWADLKVAQVLRISLPKVHVNDSDGECRST